jgi:hypothetical protein
MHDSAPPLSLPRRITPGMNERVPPLPKSQWKIRAYVDLPDHLKRQAENLPPYLTTKRAAEINCTSRAGLYQHADLGFIKSVRDGGNRLWETMSILLRLANLPSGTLSSRSTARSIEASLPFGGPSCADFERAKTEQHANTADSIA